MGWGGWRLRKFKACYNFPMEIFVYWKSEKLEEDWSVSFSRGVVGQFSTDVGLQHRTLLNITALRKCFLRLAIRLIVPNRATHQMHQVFWFETKYSITIYVFFLSYQLSYFCFICYYSIGLFTFYIFRTMNVVRTWERNTVLRNIQWEIRKILKNVQAKMV